MQRCLQLAVLAKGFVAPNPMVGAVLVYKNKIIGEGYHQQHGGPHAEVNCINAVAEKDRQFLAQSSLYVSLEPCAHFGKTPPCAEFIIQNKIARVVIGCADPYVEVNGLGVEKLLAAGIEVLPGVLEKQCIELNKRFFTFHRKQRPFIILKWAQTQNGFIASANQQRLFITNEMTNRLVHKWRSEESAIIVGTNTALLDDPSLTTRLWPGKNPLRLVVDLQLRLPDHLHMFDGRVPAIVFNTKKHSVTNAWMQGDGSKGVAYYKVEQEKNLPQQIVSALYSLGIQSLIVEGGTQLLQSFINENLWDEARVITNTNLVTDNGPGVPVLKNHRPIKKEIIATDEISVYHPIIQQQ